MSSCTVCYEVFKPSDNSVNAAPCGHILHLNCWTQWFQRNGNCPKCRQPTQLNQLIKLFFNFAGEDEDHTTLKNKYDALQCDLMCKVKDCEAVEEKLKLQIEQNTTLRQEAEKLKTNIEELKKMSRKFLADAKIKLDALKHDLSSKTEELEAANKKLQLLDDENAPLRQQAEKLQAQIEEVKKMSWKYLADARNRSNALKCNLDTKTQEYEDAARKVQLLTEENLSLCEEIERLKLSYEELKGNSITSSGDSNPAGMNMKLTTSKDILKSEKLANELASELEQLKKRKNENVPGKFAADDNMGTQIEKSAKSKNGNQQESAEELRNKEIQGFLRSLSEAYQSTMITNRSAASPRGQRRETFKTSPGKSGKLKKFAEEPEKSKKSSGSSQKSVKRLTPSIAAAKITPPSDRCTTRSQSARPRGGFTPTKTKRSQPPPKGEEEDVAPKRPKLSRGCKKMTGRC